MHWFVAQHIQDSQALLSESESHHALKVLRLKSGTPIVVIDGLGNGWHAEIVGSNGKQLACSLVSPLPTQKPPKLSIALAPTKQIDRTEWFAEKATEIGVDQLYFFTSKNSERKQLRIDRIEKVVTAAAKQSQRTFIPKVHGLISFEEVLQLSHNKLLAWCGENERPEQHVKDAFVNIKNPLIIIGPEGDFSTEEVRMAKKQNCQIVGLGDARLRTETAGVFAAAAYQLISNL
ncbi:MAG: 16S rRNA (uracil(1498)-N(3))-methyltransferase [Cryomorphaceae bacterium]|nr:16S rRNA (uracil(1498)-N(3))-methyltransferase [Cryomorphaceae bacterium]